MKKIIEYSIILSFIFGYSKSVFSQGTQARDKNEFTNQVVLDKVVDAGELKLYPGVKDKNSYWFLPQRIELARNNDGTPKFSFIKWVHNEKNDTNEGIGGGVLHCVIGFSVTDEDLENAQKELKKINKNGVIMGALTYSSGELELSVPKLIKTNEDKTDFIAKVNAPIMNNNFVAINMLLDKRSATLLKESLNTPNPVVVFNFAMKLSGYNSPIGAKITMFYEKIYNSKQFKAGLVTPWGGGEVDMFFKNQEKNGNILVEQIGENFDQKAAITKAITLATEELFQVIKSKNESAIEKPQKGGGMLSQASALLAKNRATAIADRTDVRQNNQNEKNKVEKENTLIRANNNKKITAAEAIKKENEKENERVKEANGEITKNNEKAKADATKIKEDNKKEKARVKKINEQIRKDNLEIEDSTKKKPEVKPKLVKEVPVKLEEMEKPNLKDKVTPVLEKEIIPKLKEEPEIPSINALASYVVKDTRTSGKYEMEFNESYPTEIPVNYGNNLGISKTDCPKCVTEINLDDDVFKQRQITVSLDGLNENDFSKYVNHVNVQMRKEHESGDVTFQEVRINRKNFNTEGNAFKMLYGWKGDNDRSHWLNYKIKTDYSFFGGNNIESDWESTTNGALNLSLPLSRQVITIHAEKDLLLEQKVRFVDVKVFYNLGDDDLVKQFTINAKDETLSGQVEFMLPKGTLKYDYEVTWRLYGNIEIKSERKTTDTKNLSVDELPN